MLTVTKSYRDYPAAHRQPRHDGHCRLIHGHAWGWDLVFDCSKLDANGFVIDVGKLRQIKVFLDDNFDHTLLLNEGDPLLEDTDFVMKLGANYAKVVLVPNCGMEGLAVFVFEQVRALLRNEFMADVIERGLCLVEVTCWEDTKNRSTYRP